MEALRNDLNAECDYRMKTETMDKFLSLMTEVRLKNKEPMIPYGKMDDSVYVVKEGIIRAVYFDGVMEKTFFFAIHGTLLMSYHAHYIRQPAVLQYESCGNSVVMRISKFKIDELLEQSKDFACWMYKMHLGQLYYWEKKQVMHIGTPLERLETLVSVRPEILRRVSTKNIASYVGIHPNSLSRLKKQVQRSLKK